MTITAAAKEEFPVDSNVDRLVTYDFEYHYQQFHDFSTQTGKLTC